MSARSLSMEKVNKNKMLVFLDVSIDGDPLRRMIFELFTDVAPKTAENFRALCTGEKGVSLKTGKPLHYKGTFFHHIIKGHMAEAGDFLRKNGDYGESIYGGKFPDESPKLRHDGPGLLSMAIADRDEKGSLFIVTFKADHHFDRKRVVFGKLVDGYEVLKMIENAGDDNGVPSVTVKIVNSGELRDDKMGENMSKVGKDTTVENNHEVKRKRKHKKSSRKTKKRRRYYTSESDSSTDADTSESDTDSDSDASSLSDTSSSSDDRRKRHKRSKRDRHRRGKKKDRRHEKRRRKREKKSKRKHKRDSVSDSESGSSSQDDAVVVSDVKHKPSGNQSPIAEQENKKVSHKKGEATDISEREEGEFPRENGDHQNNHNGVGIDYEKKANRHPDVLVGLTSKSRSGSLSPIKAKKKSTVISPRTAPRSADTAAKRNRSRSPSVSRSPEPIFRSRSNTPARSESSNSKSPSSTKRERSISLTPSARSHSLHSLSRSTSISPIRRRSPPKRSSLSRSPVKASRRSLSRSPVKASRRSLSRSPVKASRRSLSRSPVRSYRKSGSRSSGRAPHRRSPSPSPSPVRATHRRARSGRSSSRSPSVDGSPRIRRGRGFSDRYSYVRRFRSRSRSPERSPVRAYRHGARVDRDRYPSYRRSPRRYRSPPRARTPPRHRGRRSRTRSPSGSRSPIRYRRYSRSPYRSYRATSPRVVKRRSPSRSKSQSSSSGGSESPRRAVSSRSRSSSGSPLPRKASLVSYGDGSGRD